MYRPSTRTAAACLLALAAFTGHSYSQTLQIGVSFIGRNNDQLLGVDDLAGVVAQRDWNNLGNNLAGEATGNFSSSPYTNVTSGTLFTDDGALGTRGTSGVTVTVSANDSWNSDGPTLTSNDKLMKGIIKATNNNPITLTLNNLAVGVNYKFLAYSQENTAVSAADFALTGSSAYSTYFVQQSTSFDGTFTLGNSTDSATRSTGVDYVQWDTVSAGADGKLTLTMTYRGGAGSDGAGLAGFQLIQLAPPAGGNRFWNLGATPGTWDTTTPNFVDDANTTTAFANNDIAIFGDRGTTGARSVTVVAGGVSPASTTVNNLVANPYTIGGGAIGGVGSLTKDGPGALTLTGPNTFTGGVVLKHGTINASTIGDASAAGNLGKDGAITLGDTAGANDAVLNYTGATASALRPVIATGNGGAINIGTGTTLTLDSLNGAGALKKTGAGNLAFTGATGNFTGALDIQQGDLSVKKLSAGTGALALSSAGAASLTYSGATLNDGRNVTVGANAATISATDVNARLRLGGATATSGGNLTIGGAGRVAFRDAVSFTNLPTILPGATLALQNESTVTPNVLPSGAFAVPQGTLEIGAPSSIGATRALTLSGGTLRLGHEGLQGQYFTGGLPGTLQNDLSGTSSNVASYFAGLGAAPVSARTNTGSRTDLNFSNSNYGTAIPFADQGQTDGDNVRAYFAGKILVTANGAHTFYTTSDDGSALFIDGQRVVYNNNFQGATERSGTLNLTPGLHDIQVYYYEGTGGAGLNVEYTPFGGSRQSIPNSVLFANDVYSAAGAPVAVTASSSLEVAAARADLGVLTQTAGTTLTVTGSAKFAGAPLSAGTYGLAVNNKSSNLDLGPISGTGARIINKTGVGSLIFSQATPPAGLTVNVNDGLVVNRGSSGVDALAGIALNFNGGGLGLSSSAGDATYTTPVTLANNFRLEAGSFGGDAVTPTAITYSPAAALNIASGKTLTVATNDTSYTFNVSATVGGAGALVVDEGKVNFTSASGITAAGGLTVHTGQVNVTGGINTTGSVLVDNLLGTGAVNPTSNTLRGSLTSGAVTASSVTVSGGGIATLASLNSSGALSVNSATAIINGATTAASIGLSGTGALTLKGATTATGGINVGQGTSLTLDTATAGASASMASINVDRGTVRAQSGVTDLGTRAITFTPRVYQAGLYETVLTNNTDINATIGIPLGTGKNANSGGVRLLPRLGETSAVNVDNWQDNETWVYSGQFFDADGVFTFGENIDDAVVVKIDGATVLNNGTYNVATNTGVTNGLNTGDGTTVANANGSARTSNSYGLGPVNDGWHNIEIRFRNGGGGAGTVGGQNWGGGDNATFSNKGFGLNTAGTTLLTGDAFVIPVDGGAGNLFRVVTQDGGGVMSVDGGATLRAASTSNGQSLTLNGGAGNPARFELNSATVSASTIDSVFANSEGFVTLAANNTLTAGRAVVAAGATLTKSGPGTLVLSGVINGAVGSFNDSSIGAGGTFNVAAGKLIVNGVMAGPGTLQVSGTLSGTGNISGPVNIASGGLLAPGNGVGTLSTGDLAFSGTTTLELELTSAALADRLNVTGAVSLGNSTLSTKLVGFSGNVGDVFYVILNDGVDPITGTFQGVANLGLVTVTGGYQFQVSYNSNSTAGSAGFNNAGNDVALKLTAVPEPSSLAALLVGVSSLGLTRFRRRCL